MCNALIIASQRLCSVNLNNFVQYSVKSQLVVRNVKDFFQALYIYNRILAIKD